MRRVLPTLVAAVVLATGCTSGSPSAGPSPSGSIDPIRVGTGGDAEDRLLAEVLAELLDAAGLPATVVEFADSRDARQAIELGAIDVRPAYTGEAWLTVLGRADPPGDPRTSFARVREFDEPSGILWVRPVFPPDVRPADRLRTSPANATFAFVVQGPPGADADLVTMTELARRLAERPEEVLCVDPEFAERNDGLRRVYEAYGIQDREPALAADPADAVRAVSRGSCIAGLTTATDGAAWRSGLRPLVDDLEIFPAFVVTPQVRQEVVDEVDGVIRAIAPLPANLTTEMLGRWNARVVGGAPIEEVAAEAATQLLTLAGRSRPSPSPSPD